MISTGYSEVLLRYPHKHLRAIEVLDGGDAMPVADWWWRTDRFDTRHSDRRCVRFVNTTILFTLSNAHLAMHADAITRVPSDSVDDALRRRHDVIVIGSGIAGSSLAVSLARCGRRVLLLERDLNPPDRIVGELLQPGGCIALEKLGLRECLDDIEAVEVRGYKVFWSDRSVRIPYPRERPEHAMGWKDGVLWGNGKKADEDRVQEGRSFHHGRFVQRLRWKARRTPGVTTLECIVNDLERCPFTDTIIGVKLTPKGSSTSLQQSHCRLFATVTIVSDGCFSKFRRELLPASLAPVVRSNFVGLILDTPDPHHTIPQPGHGQVILREGNGTSFESGVGPVLVYQIGKDDTRMLVDIPGSKLPSAGNGNLKAYLEQHVSPILPESLLETFTETLNSTDPSKKLRSMPNSYLPAHSQGCNSRGVILLGDALNMRHPLTGGGMTVALNDVCILTKLLQGVDLEDWSTMQERLATWHEERKGVAVCINTLAQALYTLFGADDDNLEVLKEGCFKYFDLGGSCVTGPVSLLSALTPSPLLLFYHFFSVALYSLWVMFTHRRRRQEGRGQKGASRPSPLEWPMLVHKSGRVFSTACVVLLPVLWANLR